MTRLRLLVWLVALMALIAPPGMTVHAMAAASQTSSVDCPDPAPPPDPCPSEGTAKHAASACCPLMSGAVAVLPPPPGIETRVPFDVQLSQHVHSLVGRVFTKDPPPPRV
jgi:hypothetical protein